MKYFIMLVIICFAQQMSKAQIDTNTTTGKNVLARIEQLQNKKIDTIVCYHVFCNGGMPRVVLPDSCVAYNIVYLIWSENNKSFIQRFDECHEHIAVLIKPDFLKTIRTKYAVIKKEKIEYPEYAEKVKGKPSKIYTLTQDHTCKAIFEIYTAKNVLIKTIDDFALETKNIDRKHKNDNYLKNQKSLLNKLKKIIEYDVRSIKEN